MAYKKNVIAIVYDFDGTLSPQPMYDYGVLPKLKIKPKKFWDKVSREAKKENADQMLWYMYLLIDKAEKEDIPFKDTDLKQLSKNIEYFKGVKTHFKHLRDYVSKKSRNQVKLRFYLISAGLKEILDGIPIKIEFNKIFASEYIHDQYGKPLFPKILVNDTMKTQYLFRINKGRELQYERINEHMPEDQRPIPFSNIIYVGDGETDVPGMAVTLKNGGHSIAVYKPKKHKAIDICKKLFRENRVNHIAPADFRSSSQLIKTLKLTLDLIIHKILYSKSMYKQKRSFKKR